MARNLTSRAAACALILGPLIVTGCGSSADTAQVKIVCKGDLEAFRRLRDEGRFRAAWLDIYSQNVARLVDQIDDRGWKELLASWSETLGRAASVSKMEDDFAYEGLDFDLQLEGGSPSQIAKSGHEKIFNLCTDELGEGWYFR